MKLHRRGKKTMLDDLDEIDIEDVIDYILGDCEKNEIQN